MQNLLQSPIFTFLLAIIVIAYIVWRQIRVRKLSSRGLILFPVIVLLLILDGLPSFHPSHIKIIEMILTAIVSTILGLLACRQLKVYVGPTGQAVAEGSWTYFLWWLGALVIKSMLAMAFGETSINNINPVEIMIPILILITSRNAYLYWKTVKLGLPLH